MLSHVVGDTHPPLIEQTIGARLSEAATEFPEQEAVVSLHQNARLSFAELNHRAEQIAAGLLRLGLSRGDRVGIWAPNCVEWTLTQFATAKAGMVLVNINPAYRVFELEYALNKVGCRGLILAPSFKTSNYFEMLESIPAEKLPALEYRISIGEDVPAGFLSFASLEMNITPGNLAVLASIESTLRPSDPINIQFTSGTTGSPKGATLTHRNILNNGFFTGEAMRLTAKDRVCIPVPLYHCFGMVMGNLGCLTHGATVVYPAEAFEPDTTLAAVEKEGCTALFGVPTMFVAELALLQSQEFTLDTLRTGVMAGSPCPVEVMKEVISVMNMSEVTIAYGMTETSPVSFQSSVDDSVELRVTTVGQVQPHIEVKIIDENGVTVDRGVAGELCTKGYSVMAGYWGDEERTAESLVDGWMHTGDLATIDESGYANIVGRLKDMVIRGGENIYPREIEEFLHQHREIEEVSVFGVPDEKYGEELCAWVRKRPGADLSESQLKDFCKGQIAHFKVPRYVRFVDEFPMTVTGKLQKFHMREAMIEELGLTERASA